jgi:hypothetical protein
LYCIIDALAPESNKIFIVLGFGCSSPVRSLPYSIGAKSVFLVICKFIRLRLWPVSVDLGIYVLVDLILSSNGVTM